MNTRKLWWSLLAALVLPLALALTACGENDDNDGGSSSNSLSRTAWYGATNSGKLFYADFDVDGEFSIYSASGTEHYDGEYKVTSDVIKFRRVTGSNSNLRDGSYDYKIRGRKGDRELTIYDLFRSEDLFLEEINYDGDGSDDD